MYTCEATPYWYQIGDAIGMGDSEALYFAFPTEHREVVGKVKLAVEEIFKILEEREKEKMRERAAQENKG